VIDGGRNLKGTRHCYALWIPRRKTSHFVTSMPFDLNGMVMNDHPLGWLKFTAYYRGENRLLSVIDVDYVPGCSFVHKPFILWIQPYMNTVLQSCGGKSCPVTPRCRASRNLKEILCDIFCHSVRTRTCVSLRDNEYGVINIYSTVYNSTY